MRSYVGYTCNEEFIPVRLILDLPTDASIALRRFTNGIEEITLEEAAVLALREYLVSTGDLEIVPSIDEDSQVAGSA